MLARYNVVLTKLTMFPGHSGSFHRVLLNLAEIIPPKNGKVVTVGSSIT